MARYRLQLARPLDREIARPGLRGAAPPLCKVELVDTKLGLEHLIDSAWIGRAARRLRLDVAPANVPHYLSAKEGEVVYQESGVGPTATVPFKP